MYRQLMSSLAIPKTGLLAVCILSGIFRTPVPEAGAPPSGSPVNKHYYELASPSFPMVGDCSDCPDEIAAAIGRDIFKFPHQAVGELLKAQKQDSFVEIVDIEYVPHTSTDKELELKFSWDKHPGEIEEKIPCSNNPASACVLLYLDKIVKTIQWHDCNYHQGASSCAALKR